MIYKKKIYCLHLDDLSLFLARKLSHLGWAYICSISTEIFDIIMPRPKLLFSTMPTSMFRTEPN